MNISRHYKYTIKLKKTSMKIKTFKHSLGKIGFEINFIGKVYNLRIASRQFAFWKNNEPVFNLMF